MDDAGALHINSSDPLTQPVLLNGEDVLSMVVAQASMIEANNALIADQASLITALEEDLCSLHPPHIGRIADATGPDDFKWAGGVLA